MGYIEGKKNLGSDETQWLKITYLHHRFVCKHFCENVISRYTNKLPSFVQRNQRMFVPKLIGI